MLRRGSGLGINRDGAWHIRGEKITHERTLDTLNRGFELREDGEVIVRVGNQWAYVEIEETPLVVHNIVPRPANQPGPDSIELALSTKRREELKPETLLLVGEKDLYCTVLNGRTQARFLRPAYHNLLPFLVESAEGYALELSSGRFTIRSESAQKNK